MVRQNGNRRSAEATRYGIAVEEGDCRPFHNDRACAACLRVCPSGVFVSLPWPLPLRPGSAIDHYEIRIAQPRLCVGCRACARNCPAGAIRSVGL